MLRCGLLGRHLAHSYSPAIHALLGDYRYDLFEKEPQDVEDFLLHGDFDALNVTIPYKKDAFRLCTERSDTAKRVGSVNTIVRRSDGTLYGDNTDVFGFTHMVRSAGIDVRGKKVLVFGSGGASVSVCDALQSLDAAEVIVISRTGEDNYENLSRHRDAQVLVNTTPLGMYPNNGEAPVCLEDFPSCQGVLDLIYNPARTALLLDAERRGIPCANGLSMLVAQAAKSSERFTGNADVYEKIAAVTAVLASSMQNIVLVGMPGCGKTTVGKLLAEKLHRAVFDSDAWVEQRASCTIPELFAAQGEAAFRAMETEALQDLGKRSNCIICTGGGAVLREENYAPLHQNGIIIWLQRDVRMLATSGRPLSQTTDLQTMYAARKSHYERFADFAVSNDASAEETVRQILEVLQ